MKIKTFLLLAFSLNSCAQNSNKSDVPKEYQNLLINIETLKTGMINYMNEANPDYTEKDVNQCVLILQSYILEIAECN